MGQISLTVTGSTVGTVSFTADVSSEDSARIIAAFGDRYGIAPTSSAAVSEILRTWFRNTIDSARGDVRNYEQQRAAKAASDAVQIIQTTFT